MWLSTKHGQVNSRFVRWVRQRRSPGADGKNRWTQFALTDDGDEAEIYGHVDIDQADFVAIPAVQPMTLIMVVLLDDGEFIEHRYPIIGWRVALNDCPDPIAVGCEIGEENGGNWLKVIELEGGGYQETGFEGEHFATMEDCHATLRLRIEGACARREAKEARELARRVQG